MPLFPYLNFLLSLFFGAPKISLESIYHIKDETPDIIIWAAPAMFFLHGSQEKYINKNYGATFIFWDRIFRTYQKEEEKAIYGITTEVGSKSNPITLNFHEYRDIWKDIKSTKSLRLKLFFIFGNPIDIERKRKSILKQDTSSGLLNPHRHSAQQLHKMDQWHGGMANQ